MDLIIDIFLSVLTVYFIAGMVFGILFLLGISAKIDPLLKDSRWIVRLLLLPGCIATWPFLLSKLVKSKKS